MTLDIPLPDFLVNSPDGEVRVTGTRLGLYHLVFDYNAGGSAESIALNYRSLTLATVHKLIAFYLENRDAVDAYCRAYRADLDGMQPTARRVNLAELRRRLEQMNRPATVPE